MLRAISLAIATLVIPLTSCTQSSVNANNPTNPSNPTNPTPTNPTNSPIVQNHNQSTAITIERLGIGGIKLDMPEAQVINILGNPVNVENQFMPAIGKVRTLKYAGITVDLAENAQGNNFTVYQIKATAAQYATLDGVKVGDILSTVMKTYGNTDVNKEENLTRLNYSIETPSPAGLNFMVDNGKVTEILCFYVMN
ncbi:hypothetical protein NIES2100_42350 [Calothrix sp. NIES-2100]|uniref:hypothetical protein n=1 Tax=Calothrix sp. NIES-2100 TaxID=1954172 RepID=UPI000B603DE0|nr:hypothetical protein NIES2100_42350 [Calothrix sp. NIES-2100]